MLGVFFAIGGACFAVPFLVVVLVPNPGVYAFPWGRVGVVLVLANVVGAAALMGRLRVSYVLVGLVAATLGAFTASLVSMWFVGAILGQADV